MFEIGTSLREARLRQGLELPEVEQATKIRGKYLRALEEEQFEILPAQTYVKGFLRSYADYLGLDGQLYVDEFNSRFVPGEEETPLRPRRSPTRQREHRVERNVIVLALVGIAALAALIIAAFKFGGAEPQKVGSTTPGSTKTHVRKHRPTGVRLILTAARGPSWLLVHANSPTGNELYKGTLDAGKSLPLHAARLWINIATPDNLVAKLNGKLTVLPGGGPRIVIVSPKGIRRAAPA
jgi:hypothetical protein